MNAFLRRWGLFAALGALLAAAGFFFGWTWGFPDSALHQVAASALCVLALLMLLELAHRVRRDLRAMRERAELAREVRRHAD